MVDIRHGIQLMTNGMTQTIHIHGNDDNKRYNGIGTTQCNQEQLHRNTQPKEKVKDLKVTYEMVSIEITS